MAMNPMQRKIRNSFLIGFLVAIIIAAVVVVLLFLKIKGLQDDIVRMQTEAEIATQQVYTINTDVKQDGSLINNDALTTVSVPSQLVPENAITTSNVDELFGTDDGTYEMVAKIDISANTLLTTDMVEKSAEAGTFRRVEYTMISLPSQLEAGDYIDIRIKYPTGESFVVISKIEVEESNANSIWLTVSEGQLLLINNAIVESYIIDGSMLYATEYADAAQPAINQTYIPNENVRRLIEQNGLANLDTEIINAQDIGVRDYIDSLLGQYETSESIDKVEEGYTTEQTTIQAAREALLGDLGY